MINLFAAIETIQSTVCFSIATQFSVEGFLPLLIIGGLLLLLGHIFDQDNCQTSLPQNASLFSAFMDNLPAFAWIKDLEGRYVYVNKLVIERLTPFENDWLGKTDAELWPSEIAETYLANDLKVISSGETLEMIETYLLKGEQRYLLVTKFPIFDDTGAMTMIGATGADITALKDTEKAVLNAKKKFHDIFENAVEGIFQTTPDGQFITANAALARILGYDSPEDLLSNRTDIAREQYVDPARRTEFKRLLAKNGVVHEFEHEAYRKDGSRIWLSENVRAVCDANGSILYYEGFTEDITARKGAENEKERLLANERKLRLEALVIRDANLALTRDLSLERVLETLLEYLRKLVPYDSASVMLAADDSKFVVSAIRGYETFVSNLKVVKALKFDPKVNALFNQICSSRRSLLVPDAEREPSWQRLPVAEYTRSWIGVPLIAYGKTVGLYSVDKAEPDYFTSEHVRLVESLAAPAASAIENARLFQRGKEYARELEQRIAEREQAQEALHEREDSLKLFRRLIDRSSDSIAVLDPTTLRFLDCNTAAHQSLGYTRDEFLSLTVYDIDPAATAAVVARTTEEIANSGNAIFESVQRRKDGSTFPVEINAKTIRLDRDYGVAVVRDITERKQVEEALRRAEQNYRDIFENAGEGIFQTTPNGKYIAANPALARMYGFDSPEELICSRTDISREIYADPERRQEFKQLLETNGIVREFEHEIFRKDGNKIWITVNARAVRDAHGQVLYYEGTAQDITERKQAEAALRDSEERYRTLFENAKDAYYVHDLSGRYISVNRAAEKLSGHSREEIIGRRFTDFVSPDQIEMITQRLCAKLVDEGETTYETEMIASDGRRVPIEVSSRLIVENGVGVRIQGAARDITERKRAEAGLRQSEREYRGLFENAHDAILIIHPEQGIVLEVNQRACEIYGICRSDFIGLALQTLSLDPEHSRLRMQETLKRDASYKFETIHKRGDGEEMFLDIHASMVQYKGQPAIQSINRDITERKLSEKRLREYEKAVEGLEELIVVVDRDYKYQLANKAFLRYRETERDRLIGRPVAEFLGEAVFNQIIKQKLDECFQGNIVKYEMNQDYPNLGERNLAVRYFPIEGPEGIDRAACVLRDVTDLKRAEQALIQSEERFSKAFHSSPVALTIGALEDGRVLEINAAFTRMTGYTREESVGHTTVELGLWLGGCRQAMTDALRNHGAVDNLDVQFRKKSGEIRDGLLSAELIHLDAGPCILGIAQDVTERNRAERALQNYPRQLIQAQEAERQSIARELHDQIGQVLTAIHLNLEAIRKTGSSSEATALIDEGVIIVDEAVEQVRKLSFDLRPSLLDDLGLISALRWYADRFQQRTGITATVNISLPRNITRLRHELETACFRIVQEALTNVARHANAKNVFTELEVFGDEIRVCIKDDGVGFDTEAQNLAYLTTHLGLRGMRERALAVGGSFEIISSPLHGTEIRAVFPCEG